MKAGRESIGTIDELHAGAAQATGLDDFGNDAYREGLAVLLGSYQREAGLTPWGNRINHAMLRGALVARLLSEAAWKQHPGHADVYIQRPIIVTGLPRTGTTALHRLLCQNPANQGLEMWLTEVPQPRPHRETWDSDPGFQRIDERYRNHYVENPEFMGAHEISAAMPDECWQLLRQSMTSISFETIAHIPGYSHWLERQDITPAYERHRKHLQLIGLADSRRWALKNPGHLFALPVIMAVYPDSLIIQTHREPRAVIASMCSLSAQATSGQSDVFTGDVIGRDQMDLWARGAERFMADRAKYDPSRFVDVHYDDFVSDPVGVVAGIYATLRLQLTDDARSAMASLLEASARSSAHHYSLSDFGLKPEQVDERFAAYRRAYL